MNTYSQFKPYACKEAIKACALRLLQQNGMTTTLEVKLDLRHQGYITLQSDVSYWMDRLAREEGWKYISNGDLRIYSSCDTELWLLDLLMVCPN